MSETASNDKNMYFEALNEGGKSSESALESPSLQNDNDSSGDQGAAPVAENSKPSSINAAVTSLSEESQQSPPSKGKQYDGTIERAMAILCDFLEAALPNPPTSNFTHAQRNRAWRRKLFGLGQTLPPEISSNNRYDHEQKYPRDPPGEEVADGARVWFTYLDEAEASDREQVDGWKERADILLVFAGLFSGVITTFVVQASPSLQKDNTQVSASLLFEIAQILRAQSSGTLISHVPNSTFTPTSPFTPSTNAFLVNSLLFTSLAITLSTALFAVLAKQWLYHYLSPIDGTARERVRVRQLRYRGFELWKVGAIIDLLPILLYLAVGVFLTGIIILLFPLDIRIAWTIVSIAGITYGLYLISTILPILYLECPYTTSLTIYIGVLLLFLRTMVCRIGKTSENMFQAVWRRINFEARTIRRLLHYTRGLFRHAFIFIFKIAGVMHRYFRKLGETIVLFTDDSPKFTEWREESIKKAVQDAIFLDYEALDWLYGISPNRSLHRIIARCVAVHPIIGQWLEHRICYNLSRTLEVSETNVVDLRYGLCLDILASDTQHWYLLRSIPVEESQLEEAEYRSYFRIAKNVITEDYNQILKDAIDDNDLKLPLAMWCFFFQKVPWNEMAVHILASGCCLFEWEDPIYNAGVVSFGSEEMRWWKFEYLFRNFFGYTEPDYSMDKTFETRCLLLTTIYRNLTSDEPLIADKEQRQKSLLNLFENSLFRLHSKPCVSPEQYLAFFIDICSVRAFWCESMTDDGREAAVWRLNSIWFSMDTDVANRFPFTECDDLSPMYQWCSRDLDRILSECTTPIFTLLFMPQNRTRLCTLLSHNPDTAFHFANCFRNLGNCRSSLLEIAYIYPNLLDLLKSVNPKEPLFDILYNPSVLVQLWKFLFFAMLDVKTFFLVVKSKLDQETLNDLYLAMNEQARSDLDLADDVSDSTPDIDTDPNSLQASAHEFGRIIGVFHPRLECIRTEQSTLERGADGDHDTEESVPAEVSVPDANERGLRFIIANWTNQTFRSLLLEIRGGNRDWDVDVELS